MNFLEAIQVAVSDKNKSIRRKRWGKLWKVHVTVSGQMYFVIKNDNYEFAPKLEEILATDWELT